MCDAGIVSRHCIVLLFGIVAAVDRVFPISELFGTCGVIPVAAGRCPKFFVFVQIEVGCRRIKRLVRTDEFTNYTIHNFFHYREELHFYLKMLLKEVRKKEENFESICQNLLELIIWNITRQTQTTLSVAPTKKITKECRFIEQYLDEHFKEDITLQTLSDLTYLNKYYLVHAFKNYKGVSPINYLIEKRISEAKHLLGTTNFPIAKIASVVGFSSQSYFSQVFRKETGLSPNKYRKSMDSQNEAGGLI